MPNAAVGHSDILFFPPLFFLSDTKPEEVATREARGENFVDQKIRVKGNMIGNNKIRG